MKRIWIIAGVVLVLMLLLVGYFAKAVEDLDQSPIKGASLSPEMLGEAEISFGQEPGVNGLFLAKASNFHTDVLFVGWTASGVTSCLMFNVGDGPIGDFEFPIPCMFHWTEDGSAPGRMLFREHWRKICFDADNMPGHFWDNHEPNCMWK